MRPLAALAGVVLLGGCGLIGTGAVSGPAAPFPECQTDDYAFVGETTLGSLGLDQFGGQESGRVGKIWITANPVPMNFGPMPAGAEPQPEQMARMVCVEWPDGSGMSGSIEDDWQLPAGMTGATTEGANLPLGLIVLGVGAVVLIGVSIIAFRVDRPQTPPAGNV
jgi:hypothetical protein